MSAGIIQLLKLLDLLFLPKESILIIDKGIDEVTINGPFFSQKKLKLSQIKSLDAKLVKSSLDFDSIIKNQLRVEIKLKLKDGTMENLIILSPSIIIEKPIEQQLVKSSNSLGNELSKALKVRYKAIYPN